MVRTRRRQGKHSYYSVADPHLAVHSPAVELYFATTVAPPVLPVPEPQIWLMLLAGLALLARRVNTALI